MGRKEDDHNDGQRDGANADALDRFAQHLVGGRSEEYDAGYEHGEANPSSSKSNDSRSSDDSNKNSGGCFLTTACVQTLGLPDDCIELTTLRHFRDNFMLTFDEGRAEVKEYYARAPGVVKRISSRPNAQAIYRRIYKDVIVPCVNFIRQDQPEAARAIYGKAVRQFFML